VFFIFIFVVVQFNNVLFSFRSTVYWQFRDASDVFGANDFAVSSFVDVAKLSRMYGSVFSVESNCNSSMFLCVV
jgi:hypothetical protein